MEGFVFISFISVWIPSIPVFWMCDAIAFVGPSFIVLATSPLYDACRDNNISLVEHYLEIMSSEEINKVQPNGSTALKGETADYLIRYDFK